MHHHQTHHHLGPNMFETHFLHPHRGWLQIQVIQVADYFIGFLRGGCPRVGGNWGTLRIPREDWAPLRILLVICL